MLQPSHRGIYEYLWSEHKYPVMGVSIKAFQHLASRMGRKPQILHFLKRLGSLVAAEKSEWYNSLLNAYMHVKPWLSRQRRFEIIETLLTDQTAAQLQIYEEALQHSEKTLFGCRLFFAGQYAVYKFWDAQDKPGLWVCFGPFQLHLSTAEVFSRVEILSETEPSELQIRLNQLQSGISAEEFSSWPVNLQKALQDNNMVATPGAKAFLHPRINLAHGAQMPAEHGNDIYHTAAQTLERIWDSSDEGYLDIAQLPDYQVFMDSFNSATLPHLVWRSEYSGEEAWDFLASLFWEQQSLENGLSTEADSNSESGTGVGMEAADEEIDSEEGEHGDDETDY